MMTDKIQKLSDEAHVRYWGLGGIVPRIGIEDKDTFLLLSPIEALRLLDWLQEQRDNIEMLKDAV